MTGKKIPIGLDLELAVPEPCRECGTATTRYAARLDGGSAAVVAPGDDSPDTVGLCPEHMTRELAERHILGSA